jgi:hypothetical protein
MKYIPPYGIDDLNAPYINGDPSIGRAGSIPPAAAFEHPMRELVHMIEKSGLGPTDLDLYQLLKSIRTQRVNFAIDVGTTNNLACAFDPPLDAYNNGFVVRIRVAHPNSGPSKIDCGPGERPIVHVDGSPLAPMDMVAGGIAYMVYVDNEFQLINPHIVASVAVTGPPGTGGGGGGPTYVTNVYNAWQGIKAWESPGTYDWTVPDGVRKIWLRMWAGGGPGIEQVQSDGVFIKGGDGGYVEGIFDVVPLTLMRAVIGAGAAPPVPYSNGNVYFNHAAWSNTFGGASSFGPAGQASICSATGGRGCRIDPPGDSDPSPGQPGHGVGGAINRANGVYGRGGGGNTPSDGVSDDYSEITGGPGAGIIIY